MPDNSVLVDTPGLTLGVSSCGEVEPGLVDEETEDSFTLVFPLIGVFIVDNGPTRISATPAKVLLFTKGESHNISHPGGGRDKSMYISVACEVAEPLLEEAVELPDRAASTQLKTDFELTRMLAEAERGRLTALDIGTFATEALGMLINAAPVEPVMPHHQRLVCDAEEYLSVHFRDDCGLPTIASAVGASSHHLSRVFKKATGESLSQRRMRIRLRHALHQLAEGADDLSRVAIESGFYDHSHLTNSFRSHYGVSPSQVRSGHHVSSPDR